MQLVKYILCVFHCVVLIVAFVPLPFPFLSFFFHPVITRVILTAIISPWMTLVREGGDITQ